MNYQGTFEFYQEKKITYDFDGGKMSSDGGILLLRDLDQIQGFSKTIAACIHDKRNPALVEHTMHDLVRERLYFMAAGYEDCNDAKALSHDPVFKLATADRREDDSALASQPTLSRMENNITRQDIKRLVNTLVADWLNSYEKEPLEIVIDIDSTDDATYGAQQLTFFHGYYCQYMYHPIIFSCDGNVIFSLLRPGNNHASSNVISIMKYLTKRIRARFPKTRIVVRADAGFAIPRFFDFLEANGIPYAIGMITNPVLLQQNQRLMAQAKEKYNQTLQKQRLFQEFKYQAKSWKHGRRIIAKAEYLDQGENNRFVVTTLRKTPHNLYDNFYVMRGASENWIKELKNGFHADRLSCHQFIANQFRLLLSVSAYRLIHYLKKLLKNTSMASATVEQLRLKLFKIAVRVKESTRRVWLHFCSAYPYRPLFIGLHSSIMKLQT